MDETSLSLLSRASRESAPESWNRLAAVYTPLLRGWMARYGLQDSDADDLVQEVLLAVSRDLPSFEHSGNTGAFRRWLRTILVHRLQNFWRARRNRDVASGRSSVLQQLHELADDTSESSRLWNAEHDRHVVSQLLGQVRPRFQEQTWTAFRRVMFDGDKANDVADDLGMTLKAVHLAKARVLHALRGESEGLVDGF